MRLWPVPVSVCLGLTVAGLAHADEKTPTLTSMSACQAVRSGNLQFAEGNAAEALKAYQHAEGLEPDALEIKFNEGVARYQLQEFELARKTFEAAATSPNTLLANDAIYSVGTTYHGQALESLDDPPTAIGNLENAIHRYQSVLANAPDHQAAREAHAKAASVRRQLRELLQQQQQEQNEECDSDNKDDQEQSEDQEGQQKQQSEDQQEQQDGESQQQQESQEESQEQQAEQSDASEQQEEQEQ